MSEYGRHRVRWAKADEAFEMQCDACLDFLPMTAEFWVPKHGYARCRACYHDAYNARQRERNRVRRSDPAYRIAEVAAHRAKRHANPDQVREARREWYRMNRDRILSMRRASYWSRKTASPELLKSNVERVDNAPDLLRKSPGNMQRDPDNGGVRSPISEVAA